MIELQVLTNELDRKRTQLSDLYDGISEIKKMMYIRMKELNIPLVESKSHTRYARLDEPREVTFKTQYVDKVDE